jgi:hypothetical protein
VGALKSRRQEAAAAKIYWEACFLDW